MHSGSCRAFISLQTAASSHKWYNQKEPLLGSCEPGIHERGCKALEGTWSRVPVRCCSVTANYPFHIRHSFIMHSYFKYILFTTTWRVKAPPEQANRASNFKMSILHPKFTKSCRTRCVAESGRGASQVDGLLRHMFTGLFPYQRRYLRASALGCCCQLFGTLLLVSLLERGEEKGGGKKKIWTKTESWKCTPCFFSESAWAWIEIQMFFPDYQRFISLFGWRPNNDPTLGSCVKLHAHGLST